MCIRDSPNTRRMLDAIEDGNLPNIAREIKNVFEEIFALPATKKIKTDMIRCGALSAGMTGSGSAIFGLFSEETSAFQCRNYLAGDGLFSCCCRPCKTGPYLDKNV